jgi:hypothetical protein
VRLKRAEEGEKSMAEAQRKRAAEYQRGKV